MLNNATMNTPIGSDRCDAVYQQLRKREQQWWKARQQLVVLKQRQIFWYGDNSIAMWLLWQLISYVVVATMLMLLNHLLNIRPTWWEYALVFGLQTLFFIVTFVFRNKLARRLQNKIYKANKVREQAFSEMVILANDSIFPDIHANTPISLQHIYERYEAQLRITSLQRLLQKEIDAGRLFLINHQTESQPLLTEFADNELIPYIGKLVYKSVI